MNMFIHVKVYKKETSLKLCGQDIPEAYTAIRSLNTHLGFRNQV